MRAVIVSNYPLVKEGLCSILSKSSNMEIGLAVETMKEALQLIRDGIIDIVLLDLHEHNEEELVLIKEMKEARVRCKFIVIDFNSNKELFMKAIRCGVEGYLLGRSNEIEMAYIIDQIYKGRKFYDAYFVERMVGEDHIEPQAVEQLTVREREILCEIGMGMNNRKISEKLFISEHTVKKHINHIFDKLNIRDRTQVALYANRCGILDKSVS